MANQIISFAEALSSVRENQEPFVATANEESIDYSEAVFQVVNKTEDVQKYSPRDVIRHIFAADGLRLVSYGRNIASPISKFKEVYQKNLLMDYWDKKYQRKFMRMPPIPQVQFNEVGTQTSLTPGEAWRLYTDITPKVAVLEPDIPLASVASTTFPSMSKIARIPEITISRADASMDDLEEGALPKKGRISFRKSAEEMDKAGILLELSDEMQGNDAPYGIDLVTVFMERAGVDDEIEIVAEVIKKALDAAKAAQGNSAEAIGALSGRKILSMQSVFKRGRRADRFFGPKTAVLNYVDALSRSYGDQDTMTRGAASLAQPMIINSMSRPTLTGWLDDEADTTGPNAGHTDSVDAGFDGANNELLALDSMNSMGLITYQGDPYQAENYDVIRNVHQHVMTRWHASYVQVDAPLRLFTVAEFA